MSARTPHTARPDQTRPAEEEEEERADRDVVSKHSIAKVHATVAVTQESNATPHLVGKTPIKRAAITLLLHSAVAV